jgi:uncharacterized membrane protein YqjE
LATLRARLDTLLEAAQTRLELLAVELQEEKLRIARLLLMTVLAALLLAGALLFAVLWLTVALWDSHRLLVLGVGTLLLSAGGIAAASAAARSLAAGSALFASSIDELRRDRAALRRRDAR